MKRWKNFILGRTGYAIVRFGLLRP